jgi:3-oxoacyl-[acyl-carrier protein] reductase
MRQAVAVVTGASQGIGHSTAVRLARDFSSIVLVARNRAKLEETAKEVATAGAESLVLDIDLADKDAAKKVVEQTLATFGRIDALLNIAGAVPQIDLFEMTDQQWDAGMALKLHGARRLTINAAIIALAKAFSDRGIADGVQVNSVLPGAVMTGRRCMR